MPKAIAVLVLALLFAAPAVADMVPAGTCGKLTLYDDSDLDFRVFVALPNDPAQTDLSAPGEYAQHLRDACLGVISFQIHEDENGTWDCGVFMAMRIPDCTPETAAVRWLEERKKRAITKG